MRAGRTGAGRTRAGRTRALPSALALVAVLATGCGVDPESAARPLSPQEVPAGILTDRTGRPQPPGEREQQLYFLRDARLVPVSRPAVEVTVQTVLADLLSGPLPAEQDRGLTTALPTGGAPGRVTLRGTLAEVDLGGRLSDTGRDDPVSALGQVVLSLTALPEVEAVRFLQGDQLVAVPRGDGQVVGVPLRAEDYRVLLEQS